MNLSNGEEQVMNMIWNKKKAFMKDLLEEFPEPKPAVTTVATLLKRLTDKGAVGYKVFGNSREYYSKIQKETYFSAKLNELVKNFFNGSSSQFASFFTQETDLSYAELESLKKIIEDQLKSKTP